MNHPDVGLGAHFSTRDALAAGVSPWHLRSGRFQSPFRGVRSVGGPLEGEPYREWEAEHLHRARAFEIRMPGHAFFSHVTAAVIWGLPVPPSALFGAPVHVGAFEPARLTRAAGARGHHVMSHLATVCTDPRTGLRVTSPASTWAMLASELRHPYDLVAVGDAAVRTWRVDQPLATLEQLDAAVRAGRRIGVGRLRLALPRVRGLAASRPESWTRLTLVDAGLPEPELNHDVFAGGVKLACVDLAYPALRIAVEYDGEHHLRDPEQWSRDIRRYERLEAAGWIVIRVAKAELFSAPGVLVERVNRAIARRR